MLYSVGFHFLKLNTEACSQSSLICSVKSHLQIDCCLTYFFTLLIIFFRYFKYHTLYYICEKLNCLYKADINREKYFSLIIFLYILVFPLLKGTTMSSSPLPQKIPWFKEWHILGFLEFLHLTFISFVGFVLTPIVFLH